MPFRAEGDTSRSGFMKPSCSCIFIVGGEEVSLVPRSLGDGDPSRFHSQFWLYESSCSWRAICFPHSDGLHWCGVHAALQAVPGDTGPPASSPGWWVTSVLPFWLAATGPMWQGVHKLTDASYLVFAGWYHPGSAVSSVVLWVWATLVTDASCGHSSLAQSGRSFCRLCPLDSLSVTLGHSAVPCYAVPSCF